MPLNDLGLQKKYPTKTLPYLRKKGNNLRCSLLYKATLYTVRFFKVNEDTCVTFLKN